MSDGYSDVWNVTQQKSRKEHACEECPFPIEKGEVYERIHSLYDGRWLTYKRHILCSAAGLIDKHCTSAIGSVLEDLKECDLKKGATARNAWAQLLWRFRRHPSARLKKVTEVLDDCENYAGNGQWEF